MSLFLHIWGWGIGNFDLEPFDDQRQLTAESKLTSRRRVALFFKICRFVAPNASVSARRHVRQSRKIVFYIHFIEMLDTRSTRQPLMSFGLLDRYSPSIHNAEQTRKVISTRFLAIFARTCTRNIHEIGQSTLIPMVMWEKVSDEFSMATMRVD